MVNFPNDIYVICAYIGINVLLYQVGKIPCPNRATLSTANAIQSRGSRHTLGPNSNSMARI